MLKGPLFSSGKLNSEIVANATLSRVNPARPERQGWLAETRYGGRAGRASS